MARWVTMMVLALGLGGCAAVEVVGAAASVVGTGVSVAGSAASATIDVVGAGASLAAGSDDEDAE